MKNWFNSLTEEVRKKVVVGGWLITAALFLLFVLMPSESGAETFVSLIFVVALVFSILFTKWNSKDKKASASSTYSMYDAANGLVKEDSPEEIERKKRREEYLRNKVITAQNELESLPRYTIELSVEKRNRRTGYEEVHFSNITPKGKYNEFVVFDTETTGVSASKDRIVELAAIRFVDGVPTEVFETFINPQREISPEASAINHITNEMVADAPIRSGHHGRNKTVFVEARFHNLYEIFCHEAHIVVVSHRGHTDVEVTKPAVLFPYGCVGGLALEIVEDGCLHHAVQPIDERA